MQRLFYLPLLLTSLTVVPFVFGETPKGYVANIDQETLQNENFRKVLFTAPHSQLVVMSLKKGEEIGKERHPVDQFFRIEQGDGTLTLDGKTYSVHKDFAFIVPAGVEHNVKNTGQEKLKLYTLYSPPQHPAGTVHKTKADASRAEREKG